MEFEKLLQLPENSRDDQWELKFLDSVVSMKVEVLEGGDPLHGPDGWPYLRVRTGQGEEPFINIVRWLAGRGIGMVVNPHKMAPDYVFTYGMLWNFVETGRFVTPWAGTDSTEIDFTERPIIGAPTDQYLPPYVRDILNHFLKDQGIQKPRIAVATSRDFKQTDLVFSLESMGAPDPKDQKALAEVLSWFLPLHYSLTFIQEDNLSGWVDL